MEFDEIGKGIVNYSKNRKREENRLIFRLNF